MYFLFVLQWHLNLLDKNSREEIYPVYNYSYSFLMSWKKFSEILMKYLFKFLIQKG